MNCALPPICPCCQGRRFAYLAEWRYVRPRERLEQDDPTAPFSSGVAAGDNRMLATTRREAESAWSSPTQENLPVSLRLCASCGAAQPYVDVTGIRVLVDGAEGQAVYVDHSENPGPPYR
jgi:hypothetical protein